LYIWGILWKLELGMRKAELGKGRFGRRKRECGMRKKGSKLKAESGGERIEFGRRYGEVGMGKMNIEHRTLNGKR